MTAIAAIPAASTAKARPPELARKSHRVHRAAVDLGADQDHGARVLGLKTIALDPRLSERPAFRAAAAWRSRRPRDDLLFELGVLGRIGAAESVTDESDRRTPAASAPRCAATSIPGASPATIGSPKLYASSYAKVCALRRRRAAADDRDAACAAVVPRTSRGAIRSKLQKLHVRAVERGDVAAAQQAQRANDVAAQDLDRPRDARAAGGAEPIGVGAADQHRARAQTERLDDVAAAANSAVEEDLGAPVDGVDDLGQGRSVGATPSS